MLISPIEEKNRDVSGPQFRRPVTNFCPPGAGLLRLQVVACLTALAGGLVVVHGHQEQNFGYYQVSLRDVNRACELTIFVNAFLKRKNKYLILFLPFCYNAQGEGGRDLFYKVTECYGYQCFLTPFHF